MMAPPFVVFALLYALVRSVGAASPLAQGVSLAASDVEVSPLLSVRRLGINSCGEKAGKSCDPNSTGGGWCCSRHGYCGNGEPYCGKGCQDKYGKCDLGVADNRPPKVQFCGSKHNNAHCSTGDCCSSDGLCGNSGGFCGAGCQSKFGTCEKDQSKAQQKCGPKHDNKKCPFPQCCSHAGNCGMGKDFCAVPGNCQRGFGFCDSDKVPAGYNVSTDSRQHKGEVKYGQLITACKVPRTIALTFDDGPSANTEELLDILKDANAKATFFVSGNSNGKGSIDSTPKWTNAIKRMVKDGHQVGSHTWSHPEMDKIGPEARKLDMLKNERALANILGKYPTYMRPPYLHCSRSHGCLDDMEAMGYHIISYSYDSGDWLHPNDLGKMRDRIDAAFEDQGRDGNMLLIQHDTIHDSAIQLTKYILQKVQEKHWHAISVGECLGDEPQNWYRQPLWSSPAATPREGCTVSERDFCGRIHAFKGRKQCFESNQHCEKDAQACQNDGRADKEACQKMERACKLQFLYCTKCGKSKDKKSEKPCEIDHFVFSKQD